MAVITWNGKKATIKTCSGVVRFSILRLKGMTNFNLISENGNTLKGGFSSLNDAKLWLSDYLSFVK